MDEGEGFDHYREQVVEAVRHAEVVSLFFPRLGKAMILDVRRTATSDPALLLDDMARSPRARLASFRRLRPDLPLPERLTLAAWDGQVHGLEDAGILDALIERCRFEGGDVLASEARRTYRRLLALEVASRRELVRGDGMHTLWQRHPSPDA